MPYLSGYVAKKRDVEREDLSLEVKRRMNDYATTLLKSTVTGYSTVSTKDLDIKINKSHWEYSLLPVWVLTYRSKKGKIYTYAMNGHTGKVYGELPISFAKLGLMLAGVVAALTPIFMLLGGLVL